MTATCERCGAEVNSERVQSCTLNPRNLGRWTMANPAEGVKDGWVWLPPTPSPVTCVPCQREIDTLLRRLAATGPEPAPVAQSPAMDSHGLPDYTGPAAPAPALKVIGPDTVCWPVTVSHAANSHIDSSPYHVLDGSLAYATDRTHPGLPPATRTYVRNLLAQVGINSLGSWLHVSRAQGAIGQQWRKRARAQVESTLRLPPVTDWLAAQHRCEHEHEADPGQVTGDAILPGVESTVEALECELAYLDPDGTPEAQRRPGDSLAYVPQSPSALDAGTRQRQHERIRYRTEHSLSRAWERYPSGTPRGAVEVTDLDGVPIRTDLPPWPEPEPSAQSSEPTADRKARKAESARRARARARAAETVASAAASGDVARLAAAQRAAGRTVSAAVSSHPWE